MSCGCSAIGFTETFLTSDDPNSLLLVGAPSCVVFRSDHVAGRGGGVALFCMQGTNPVHVSVPDKFAECECIAVDLSGCISYHVICAYRPPNASTEALYHSTDYWTTFATAICQ